MNDSHITAVSTSGGIINQGRVNLLRLPLVVGVDHFLRIDIADLFLHAVRTLNGILETVFLARLQTGQGDPEIIAVTLHLVRRIQFPVGHIAEEEDAFGRLTIARGVGAQRHRPTVGAVVNTIADTRRTSARNRSHIRNSIPYIATGLFTQVNEDVTRHGFAFLASARTIVEDESKCFDIRRLRHAVERIDIRYYQLPFIVAQSGQLRLRRSTP